MVFDSANLPYDIAADEEISESTSVLDNLRTLYGILAAWNNPVDSAVVI